MSIPGLTLASSYLDDAAQDTLLGVVDALPWSAELRRRVQHYGYRYDYKRKSVDATDHLGPLPTWAAALAARLHADGHAPATLDQLIVNEYQPGQGIASHVDCVPCFADTVLSISLGSSCVMVMSRRDGEGEKVPLLLEPGALLVMTGEARYDWLHGIPARKTDRHDGGVVVRGRRVSLTFRTVVAAQRPQVVGSPSS
ncbi:alpha-ketoglutarate-dependent dioxygenase AlkB [Phytomonospora endophytica]|uniref:Alkylated DNA repair dioxygenase AlkB n=1 Tax=Phytomonospora endophytica TaxID=714109 RepID=A0A841FG05_9ACTN|nr:alpha-ketoglutarate-dependent dioxygenase AlkB [Phytomonospora endophytica]MBB6033933.1 alkylated DNA repair dioxygenase AlkB [Phytomonospora endophytica]GIG64546.1 alpha-ketoglutarate-dependent dioxygenase AlkB [Phytomonospora endophytica]